MIFKYAINAYSPLIPKFFTFVAEEDRQQLVEFRGTIHCDFLRSDLTFFHFTYIASTDLKTRWRKHAGDTHSAKTIPVHLSSPVFIELISRPPSGLIGTRHSHAINIRFDHSLLCSRIRTRTTWIFPFLVFTLFWSMYLFWIFLYLSIQKFASLNIGFIV